MNKKRVGELVPSKVIRHGSGRSVQRTVEIATRGRNRSRR